MNSEKAPDEVRLARAGEAAFRRNAEFRHVILSKRDAFVCAFDSVRGMNEPEIDLGTGRQGEFPHGREEVVGGAHQRHRQMNIGDLVLDAPNDRVGRVDEMASRVRIEIMFATEITITEMESEVDIGGHLFADAGKARRDVFARGLHEWELVLRVSVPHDHVVADIPLDAEILMRNVAADRLDFLPHGRFISDFNCHDVPCSTEGIDDAHRRRQADLEADAGRDITEPARFQEIEIRGTRLASVAELSEPDLTSVDAFGEAEQWETRGLSHRAARVRAKEGARAEQWILEAGPQPARAGLAVW